MKALIAQGGEFGDWQELFHQLVLAAGGTWNGYESGVSDFKFDVHGKIPMRYLHEAVVYATKVAKRMGLDIGHPAGNNVASIHAWAKSELKQVMAVSELLDIDPYSSLPLSVAKARGRR